MERISEIKNLVKEIREKANNQEFQGKLKLLDLTYKSFIFKNLTKDHKILLEKEFPGYYNNYKVLEEFNSNIDEEVFKDFELENARNNQKVAYYVEKISDLQRGYYNSMILTLEVRGLLHLKMKLQSESLNRIRFLYQMNALSLEEGYGFYAIVDEIKEKIDFINAINNLINLNLIFICRKYNYFKKVNNINEIKETIAGYRRGFGSIDRINTDYYISFKDIVDLLREMEVIKNIEFDLLNFTILYNSGLQVVKSNFQKFINKIYTYYESVKKVLDYIESKVIVTPDILDKVENLNAIINI